MEIYTNKNDHEIAKFIANSISTELNKDKKVLWFASGGSSISIASLVSLILHSENQNLQNLTVTLTDERYGEIGHADSNWQQLQNAGFILPKAKLIPILSGKSIEETTLDFKNNLITAFKDTDYSIGLFGAGIDMHTAGILPETLATTSLDLTTHYHTEIFNRITITLRTIRALNEAILYLKGKNKLPVLERLKEKNKTLREPVQALKEIKKLAVFFDSGV